MKRFILITLTLALLIGSVGFVPLVDPIQVGGVQNSHFNFLNF